MKQTILNTKQSELLESLLAAYGHIVTSEQIYSKASASSKPGSQSNMTFRLLFFMIHLFFSSIVP